MPTRPRTTRATAAAVLALTVLLGACVGHNPLDEPDGDPDATPHPTLAPTAGPVVTPAPTPTPTPTRTPIGSAHVALTVATTNAVTIDVTDASGSLLGAASGAPGDGASVEAYRLVVTNTTPTTLRLTWVGGPCDSANRLSIDAGRRRLLLVQAECPGDAIATDRILDLEFSTAIDAAGIEAFLQDGLDT
jgi:hypothetical protein